ncbi:TPA: DUF2326 domain-containing protein [Legionella pneumophila]|nr:DUF2326 domain-containing protein [Legionella pneumophila]HAU4023024.1 DUF2326 domain-containing protein [Legionella pneumophila]
MKISKLYSNKSEVFIPIIFNKGLNAILAEIRLLENKKKDTHNLGKTTLCHLINFCLLATKKQDFFLFKNMNVFKDFVFYIEIYLLDGSFLTIKRSVENATKISFKKSDVSNQDFSSLPDIEWDHLDVPFETAKELFDGQLDLETIKPWDFRTALGYLLRSQDDFRNIFQVSKFTQSKHVNWKPYLAHIMGFDADLILEHYKVKADLKAKQDIEQTLSSELDSSLDNLSKIEGMMSIKKKDIDKKQKFLDEFDFRSQDIEKTKELVDELDIMIADLNTRRYYLEQDKKKIDISLEEDQILFDPNDAHELFAEAGVLFDGQIKKSFEQLIEFNRSITKERREYLVKESKDISQELDEINKKLNRLGLDRSRNLSFLSESDLVNKYKMFSNEMVNLKADVKYLETQRERLERLNLLRKDIRSLTDKREKLQDAIENDYQKQCSNENSLFSSIQLYFNEIISEVLDKDALLSISINKEYHLEFAAEIIDKSGNRTSEGKGHTYQKLLCIAFDLAIARAHSRDKFPHFVFHDGVFESLDKRKKENLLNVLRKYTEKYNIQEIITLIDSDLPSLEGEASILTSDETILLLHDEGDNGRLFRIPPW